ncbi:Prephenate dehydratase-domain-containing protein [Gloeopeniophorella convolvens]|nr:Prephenate dehydratase-domain-containing protein [Gloeopeniophorella convolvens]
MARTDDERPGSRPNLAFLGPAGTYSHQAAHDKFAEMVHYHTRDTIADVFHSVGPSMPLALVPQENSIFGIVSETYDLLRSPNAGQTKWVRGAVTLPIQHCLLVRRGKTLQDIKKVLSHEQALGQCRQFLATHLPNAQLVGVPSTAAAAEVVSTRPDTADHAAICSKICVQLFAGLEILHEGIQNERHNYTRFYVLANHPSSPLPNSRDDERERHALIRLDVPRTPSATSRSASTTVTDLLATLHLPAARVDRRPSAQPDLFHSVYFVEVTDPERLETHHGISHAGKLNGAKPPWRERVLDAIARVTESGGRADLLGTW